MEQLGGARAREIAERFWTKPDEAAMADYMTVCMPLYNPRPSPGEADARKRAIQRLDVAQHFILGEMRRMNALPTLAGVCCPTLLLAGAHDPITPVECSKEIASALPDSLVELSLLEDAGHGVHRDSPERAEVVLRRFLSA